MKDRLNSKCSSSLLPNMSTKTFNQPDSGKQSYITNPVVKKLFDASESFAAEKSAHTPDKNEIVLNLAVDYIRSLKRTEKGYANTVQNAVDDVLQQRAELLEACKLALAFIRDGIGEQDAEASLGDAIAKMEGK